MRIIEAQHAAQRVFLTLNEQVFKYMNAHSESTFYNLSADGNKNLFQRFGARYHQICFFTAIFFTKIIQHT